MSSSNPRTIPIRPLPTQAPAPRVPAPAPALSGPASRVEGLLGALGTVMATQFGRPVAPGEWLQALRLADGEAVLRLRRDLGCRTGDIGGAAFETMRRLLPDTDIFIGV